ncbi:MAG: hypothetical protein HFG89_00365 [Dorea sp.]|jgi:hypothetical protein|nr:hypothetical protein [Dorea sp.]
MEENKNQTPEGQQAEEQSVAETKGAAVGDESKNENVDTAPNTDTLMAEIARMKVSEQKMKKELDKALKEKGEVTKALRAKQTAAELEDEAKREEEERHQEYVMELEEFKRKTEAKERYLMQGMSVEMATKAADAEVSGDMEALTDIQRQHTEATLKAARAEWQKSIPQPNFGTGEYASMSKKDIMAIKDTAERQKAILANRHMFGI